MFSILKSVFLIRNTGTHMLQYFFVRFVQFFAHFALLKTTIKKNQHKKCMNVFVNEILVLTKLLLFVY